MSIKDVAKVANSDTPSDVHVPETIYGIAAWLIGRFGIGIVTIAILAYAASVVYNDDHALIQRVIAAFEERSKIDSTLSKSNTEVAEAMKSLAMEVRDAHIRASGKLEASNKPAK